MKYLNSIFLMGGFFAFLILSIGLVLYSPQTAFASECIQINITEDDWTFYPVKRCPEDSTRICDIRIRTVTAETYCDTGASCADPTYWDCVPACEDPKVVSVQCNCDENVLISIEWQEFEIYGSCFGLGDCFCDGCEDDNPPYNIARYETSSADCY